MLAHEPRDIPTLHTLLDKNSAGNRPAGAPLLVVQGTDDEIIPQSFTDEFVKKACAAGDTVDYRLYTRAIHPDDLPVYSPVHDGVPDAAANDVAAWFADRVSGAPATSTC